MSSLVINLGASADSNASCFLRSGDKVGRRSRSGKKGWLPATSQPASQPVGYRQFNLCSRPLIGTTRPRWSDEDSATSSKSFHVLSGFFFNSQWELAFQMTLTSLQLDATAIKGRRVFHPLSRNQLGRQTRGGGEGGSSITTTSLKFPFVPYVYVGFFRIRLYPIASGHAREEMRPVRGLPSALHAISMYNWSLRYDYSTKAPRKRKKEINKEEARMEGL